MEHRPWLDPVDGIPLEYSGQHKLSRQREYVGSYPNRPVFQWLTTYPRDYIWSRAHFAERQNDMLKMTRREDMWPIRFTHNLFGEANAFGIKVLIPIRRAVRSWVRRIRELRINERKYAPGGEGYYRAKRSFGVMSGTERATRAFTRRLK